MIYQVGIVPRTALSVALLTEKGKLFGLSKGVKTEVAATESFTLSGALQESWNFDAHALTYYVQPPGQGDPVFFRLKNNSPAMNDLLASGFEILTNLIFLDYDNPGHEPWESQAEAAVWLQHFEELFAEAPEFLPYCVYTTKHGARMVYRLASPCDVRDIGRYIASIMQDYQGQGIELDETCVQWHRIYRLPNVDRDGDRTGETPTFLLKTWDTYLDLKDIEPAKDPEATAAVVAYTSGYQNMPSFSEVEGLLVKIQFDEATGRKKPGRPTMTNWYRMAKKVLKNSQPHLFEILCKNKPMPLKGGRDTWLTQATGTLVGALRTKRNTTPEHILALLWECLDRLETDEDTPSWHVKAWDLIQRLWQQDEMRDGTPSWAEPAPVPVVEEPQKSKEEALVASMRDLYPDIEELQGNYQEARDWVLSRAILSHLGKTFYILQPDGRYTQTPVTRSGIVPTIRNMGMEEVYNCLVYNENEDTLVPRAFDRILADHGVELESVEFSCFEGEARLERASEAQPVLRAPSCQINTKIHRRFDPEVDQWLRCAVGDHVYPELEEWLVAALEVQGPLPLLSIVGGPSCGKSLLVRGVAECFSSPTHCDSEALVGGWNAPLLRNPLIYVDEGLSGMEKHMGLRGISEKIRQLLGGAVFKVKEKNVPEVYVESNPRIIATANNYNILAALVGQMQRDTDLQAIQTRIVHFNFRQNAADFLKSKGERLLTKHWVGSNSQHRLAGHLLWLWENKRSRFESREGRFLVEGRIPMRNLLALSFRHERAADVVVCILTMIEHSNKDFPKGLAMSFEVKDSAIFVQGDGVLKFSRENYHEYGWNFSAGIIKQTLELLGTSQGNRSIRCGGKKYRAGVWFDLDLEKLCTLAEELYDGEILNLAAVVKARYGTQVLESFLPRYSKKKRD